MVLGVSTRTWFRHQIATARYYKMQVGVATILCLRGLRDIASRRAQKQKLVNSSRYQSSIVPFTEISLPLTETPRSGVGEHLGE